MKTTDMHQIIKNELNDVALQNPHAIRAISQLDNPEGEFTLVHHGRRGATAIPPGRHLRCGNLNRLRGLIAGLS